MRGRKGQRGKPQQRSIAINQKTRKEIAEYAKYIPSLKKVSKAAGKYRITPAQMAQVSAARKKLANRENLKPVTAAQAKKLKKSGALAGHGVQAVRLRNTSPEAKISVRKSGIIVTSNGRRFEYHPSDVDPDIIAELGESLLARPDVKTIYLWTSKGRASEGFSTLSSWMFYLKNFYEAYSQIQDWIRGVVAHIAEDGETVSRKTERERAQDVREKVEKRRGRKRRSV